MFDQNNSNPYGSNSNPYGRQFFGQNIQSPYIRGVTTNMPQPMAADLTENELYPLESSLSTPQFNTGAEGAYNNYAEGGMVQRDNGLSSLAELIRQQGNNEDTILAHINPLEAMMLKSMGGSGTINPRTGLPQFSFWSKPFKAIKSMIGGGAGALLGNVLLPGIGGVIGGALGQGTQHAIRGKSFGQGALKGGFMGAMLPSAASLAGAGATGLGATGLGATLSSYGAHNALLPALGLGAMGGGMGAAGAGAAGAGAGAGAMGGAGIFNPLTAALGHPGAIPTVTIPGATAGAASGAGLGMGAGAGGGFLSTLMGNTSNFLSNPLNLMALGSAAASYAGRPKEKSPEKKAQEQKRYQAALQLTPQERAALEASLLANRQMERRIARNQYLPEERFDVKPLHRRAHTPDEYKKTGRWLSYYDNPEMTGNPLLMKRGGRVPDIAYEEMEVDYPSGEGMFLEGHTKGQDDKIEAFLSDGEYVIPADVVSHMGDGNSMAGGKQLDKFVKNVRVSKGVKNKLPPKAKPLSHYLRKVA